MADPHALAEAFRQLQAGNPAAALEAGRRIAAAEPGNARASMIAGIALRMLGRLGESRVALEQAARLDANDYAAAYESGLTLEALGEVEAASAEFQRATSLRPAFVAAHVSLAKVQAALRHWDAARSSLTRALEIDPRNPAALRASGSIWNERGEFARAAEQFAAALAVRPADPEISMLLAQVELLRGNWAAGWRGYRHREQRAVLERAIAAQGQTYRVPTPAELDGREVTLIGEQGLGDILFFLRFAPWLAARSARMNFIGDDRLRPLLERTGLFAAVLPLAASHAMGAAIPLLVADLPAAVAGHGPSCPGSLRIPPDGPRSAKWERELEAAGPRPWIGITWRAGTPRDVLSNRLFKAVAPQELAAALRPQGGTVFAVQRAPKAGEIEAASRALGRPVHDLTRINDDLDDALATMALLDRYIGVSNTNMHLREAAGATADVLVPFPPEWRWGLEGESPWFPGFRVHRQSRDAGWSEVLARLD